MLGEEGQYHGHETAEDTRLMVTEGACGRPYLGREAFIQVRHHLPLHAAAGAHSLQDKAHRNPQEVGGEQVERCRCKAADWWRSLTRLGALEQAPATPIARGGRKLFTAGER
jgi:hypothetical protein